MRRTMLMLGAALGLVTAVTLLALASTLLASSSRSAQPSPSAAPSAVTRFYDAINQAIATGDPRALLALLAPGFVDHGLPGAETGRDNRQGEIDAVAGLRRAHPAPRFTAVASAVDGDRVIIYVHESGGATAAGITATPDPTVIVADRVEVLRLAGGLVAERWVLRDGAPYWQPVPATATTVPPVETYLTVQAQLAMPAEYAPLLATAIATPG